MLETSRRTVRNSGTRGDLFDVLLRWAHRILNPPAPAGERMGDRRRIRDRVPL